MADCKKIQINDKITSYEVITEAQAEVMSQEKSYLDKIAELEEKLRAAEGDELITVLPGVPLEAVRYKLDESDKSSSACYIIISNVIVDGYKRPYEIFINSKHPEHFQWITALTRVITAVFRKNKNSAFIADELCDVFDVSGGYWRKGGKYYNSIVAEIGEKIKEHFLSVADYNKIKESDPFMSDNEIFEKQSSEKISLEQPATMEEVQLQNATFCPRCRKKTLIKAAGCEDCVDCGYSRCSG